jgi:WD40 repeat protein
VIEVPGFFLSIAISPDGRTIATNSGDFNRWDLESGEQMPLGWSGFGTALPGGRFPAGGVAYSPDGRTVATAHGEQRGDDYQSVIFFWDARTGHQLGEMAAGFTQEYSRTIAYSPDGNTLAAVSGPMLRAWDTQSRRELVTRKTSRKHFQGLAFTPDGRRLITVSNDKTARLWDCSTWTEAGGYEWKIGKLRSVAVSPDGLRFAAGGDSGQIVIWDNDT